MVDLISPSISSNSSIQKLVCEPCWNHLFNFDSFQKALATQTNPQLSRFTYNLQWETIRASASAGCNWCKLLSKPANEASGEAIVSVSFSTENAGYTPTGVKILTLSYGSKDCFVAGETGFRLYTTADNPAAQIILPRDRILQINTPNSFKLATHEECPKHKESTLPDRVIDCSDVDHPRIVVTKNAPGVYAALSYVWGKQTYLATTENIDTLIKHGIDTKKAPITILNAILSAHSLGIPYLWIDAFCILQDSDEDKGRQIGKMNEIYTNAYFTIIAACSNDAFDGFLQDRPARIPSANIPFVCPDGQVGHVFLASTEMVGYDVTQMYHDELEPREIVSIGGAFCEPTTGPSLPKAFSDDVSNLTHEEKIRTMEDLLWEVSIAGEGPLPRPKVYRAPSWSWASVNSQTQIPNTENKLKPGAHDVGQCKLVQCEVIPAHKESLFAAVTSAFVKLETFLHKVTISSGVYSESESQKVFLDAEGDEGTQAGQHIGNFDPDTTEYLDTDQLWIVPILWDRGGISGSIRWPLLRLIQSLSDELGY
ncbi:hypothetical protein JR316_0004389 [Psilocybe cubensis]|uniref:Uncharacterized protein n=2 Tax=Psilocybe cubensis TaxID=181762 RepID=A0ACB8H472_PSICU|nr:hypothetical protein JR316_0004389 [Psilocybe cubensis]KAH9482291.1 hypothetical protein JR316_0004389 [Psilocybe cubensis]